MYAIEYTYGIKIGISVNPKSRIKSYLQSGAQIKVICHGSKVNSKKCDKFLKKWLNDNKLKVTNIQNNKQTSEVYNINADQAIKLIKALSDSNTIDEKTIENIIYTPKFENILECKYLEILNGYSIDNKNIIKSPEFQRKIDFNRVESIKNYIINNWNKEDFYLPPIVLNKINNNIYIIDGQHRCAAISQISPNHLIFNEKTKAVLLAKQYENLNLEQQLNLFKSINNNKQMHPVYLKNNKYSKLASEIKTYLINKYTNSIDSAEYKKITKFSNKIQDVKINDFVNFTNINLLVSCNIIKSYKSEELINFIELLNYQLYQVLLNILSIDNFNKINPNTDKFQKSCEKVLIKYFEFNKLTPNVSKSFNSLTIIDFLKNNLIYPNVNNVNNLNNLNNVNNVNNIPLVLCLLDRKQSNFIDLYKLLNYENKEIIDLINTWIENNEKIITEVDSDLDSNSDLDSEVDSDLDSEVDSEVDSELDSDLEYYST
jgi:hypothetical protein